MLTHDRNAMGACLCAFVAGATALASPVAAPPGVPAGDGIGSPDETGRIGVPDDPGACCDFLSGACTLELRADCEDAGNTFLGMGTLCTTCDAGDNAGQDCVDDGDCPGDPPGSCEPRSECTIGACCDSATGVCREITAPDTCGTGELFLGFGSDCYHNCCPAPIDTGGDNCADVVIHAVSVPAFGDPAEVITITGNNSPATYDDFPDFCGATIFDPNGERQDPGWWEAFATDDCALVTIDLCCTDVNGQHWTPAWGNLVSGCPCEEWIAQSSLYHCPVCFGGFWVPYCDDDNIVLHFGPLPAGTYYYPIYSAPGGTGASPPGADYQLHIKVAPCPQSACCVENDCYFTDELACQALDGRWLGSDDCGNDPACDDPQSGDNPCCTGSCCIGPGECEDVLPGGPLMTKAECDGLEGQFVGGPTCDADPLPCPVCLYEDSTGCQMPDLDASDMTMMSDRSMPPSGVVVADDFIPIADDPITSLCVWGNYLDAVEILAAGDANEGGDCSDDVTDDFHITVYPDLGGIPDAANPGGQATGVVVARGPVDSAYETLHYAQARMFSYQLEMVPPITGLSPGVTYWLEVANNTAVDADDGQCMWHWAQTSTMTNNFHMVGVDSAAKSPAYVHGMGRAGDAGDMAFCLDIPVVPPLPVVRQCCDCDTGVCTISTLGECGGEWDQTGDCSGACPTVVPGDVCAVNPIATADPNFTYTFDSRCAETDGPESETAELGIVGTGRDIWVHYTAPCNGKVHAHMCGTGNSDNAFDSVLAVYENTDDPTTCACPGDPGFQRIGLAQDESCNGTADGGAGYLTPPPLVSAGDCLTIRAAGYDNEAGVGTVEIHCEEQACAIGNAPVPDPTVVDSGHGTRIRYLSFSAGNPGVMEAIRVTFDELPPPFDSYNGDRWFVGQPFEITESSGTDGATPGPTFWAATLQCGTPRYDDWAQYGTIHVYDAGILPDGVYTLQAIGEEFCDIGDVLHYSEPLTINTSRFGDVVGDCGVQPCSAPQGVVDYIDISAVVEKFKNAETAPKKSRADVIHSNPEIAVPDLRVDFVDIASVVDAFRGSPPTLPGPQTHCP